MAPRINNLNIESLCELPSPVAIRSELPLTDELAATVAAGRRAVREILDGKSPRLLVITGPCSIHDADAAAEYARRLAELKREVGDRIEPVMRAYFEKPRTTIGWKGLIYDPDLNSTYDIVKGLRTARRILLNIVRNGLAAATEMLDPITAQYIADCVSWAAIGARTTEAQTHRQLGSGLSMPVGFKNATDGSLQIAIDAVATASQPHHFIGVLENGHVGVFSTRGNPGAHIVLRGGRNQPNYGSEYIAMLRELLRKNRLPARAIVDCSHDNSGKKPERQREVFHELLAQLSSGEETIRGMMLESNLMPGKQRLVPGTRPDPAVSITDGCIGWEETAELIREAHRALAGRFR